MGGTVCAVLAAISVFRIGGHSHTCRTADAVQSVVETKLAEWAVRNHVDAPHLPRGDGRAGRGPED